MADVKISALTAVVTPALTDVVPVVQGGVTKQETLTQVRAALMPVVLSGADVSGTLPAASVIQASGTGIPHVVAGVLQAASSLIVNADVNAAAAIALSKIVNPTGTGIATVTAGAFDAAVPANLLAGAGYLSIGATPAATGALRLPNGGATNIGWIYGKTTGGIDRKIIGVTDSDNLDVGDGTLPAYLRGSATGGSFVGVGAYFGAYSDRCEFLNTTPPWFATPLGFFYKLAVSNPVASRTITLPLLTANDTFVFADFAQTLTNKTLTSPAINGATIANAVSVSIGATPATAGAIRLANTESIYGHDGTAGKVAIAGVGAGGNLYFGTDTSDNAYQVNFTYLTCGSGGNVATRAGGWVAIQANATTIDVANPIVGYTPASSPYGVHGVGIQAMAGANQTPSASVHCYGTIRLTGSMGGDRDLTLPTATDAAAYTKIIDNQCTDSGGTFAVCVRCASGASVYVPNGAKVTVIVDANGVTHAGHKYDVGSGMVAIAVPSAVVLTQNQWERPIWKFTGSAAGTNDITLPLPTAGQSYTKYVRNDTTAGTLDFKCSSGTTKTFPIGPNFGVLVVTSDGVVGSVLP